jgi:methyl-accepting chemotaxis protein
MNLKTRTKLILMGAVPTIALLYFAVSGTMDKATIAAEMTRLEALVEVSVKIGDLAHELQKERGLSAGFISSCPHSVRKQTGRAGFSAMR